MISLQVVFWILLFFFAAVGAIRGWVREILVTSSLVVGFVIIVLLWKNSEPVLVVDPVSGAWALQMPIPAPNSQVEFFKRVGVLLVMAFIGYETAGLGYLATRTARVRRQDMVLGFILGLFNGYLLVGSLWYYLAGYGYPLAGFASPELYGLEPPNLLRYMYPAFMLKPVIGSISLAFATMVVLFIFLLLVLL